MRVVNLCKMSIPPSRSVSRNSRLSSVSGSSNKTSRKSSKRRRKSKDQRKSFEYDDDYLDDLFFKVKFKQLLLGLASLCGFSGFVCVEMNF